MALHVLEHVKRPRNAFYLHNQPIKTGTSVPPQAYSRLLNLRSRATLENMTPPVHAIIFDLDGTLLNTITDIANCANTVLESWALPVHPVNRYAELVGDGLANLARKVLPPEHVGDASVSRFIDEYRVHYQDRWNETSTWYPGIPELLRELSNSGISMAILSNKRDDFTKVCVSSFFPTIAFQQVRGERAGIPIKPNPQSALEIVESLNVKPENCLFVGDSEIDIETGIRAGMTSVGVLWGFRPRFMLEEAGAHVLVSHPEEILGLLGER